MPNRIIKESICTSEEIDKLTPEQEVFFYRLLVACDDYGLMDARPAILKARCYPLKSIESKRIQTLLDALNSVGLVSIYKSDGKDYLHVTNWEKHQTIRAKKPKYPYPQSDEIICKQMQADVPVIQSNPIQEESNRIQPDKPANKKGSVVSPDFTPNETSIRLADELGIDWEAEVPKFIDHHTHKGTIGKDWNAGFRTWLNNSVKFGTAKKAQPAANGVLRSSAIC